MKKILVPAAIAALVSVAPLAALAKTTGDYSGTVKSVNTSNETVTLTDGETFSLDYAGMANQLKPGTTVNLRWEDVNGETRVMRVLPS